MHEPNSGREPNLGFRPKASSPDELAPTDAELLARFVSRRDQAAFEQLLLRHGPMVFGTCCRILRRHHEAEDAFQTTFLSLAKNARRIGRPELVANWLFRVARHSALKVKQAAVTRQQKEQQMVPVPRSNPDQAELWAELAPVLDDELDRLADKLRITVVLCDIEGKTRKEAARQLGCPEATVSSRLMKARTLLAGRLARQGIVLSAATVGVLLSQHAATAAVPKVLLSTTLTAATAVGVAHPTAVGFAITKPFAFLKGAFGSALLGKTAVAVTAAGVTAAGITTAAVMYTPPSAPPQPAEQVSGSQLPADMQQALEENARQLGPISMNSSIQIVSRLPEAEVLQRLRMDTPNTPVQFLFEPRDFRLVWQDQKFFMSQSMPTAIRNGQKFTSFMETTYDGRVFCNGTRHPSPLQLNPPIADRPGAAPKKGLGMVMMPSTLFKESAPKSRDRSLFTINGERPYFTRLVGFVFSRDPHVISSGGEIVEQKLQVETELLNSLRDGGKLLSIEKTTLDGRPCVRVELDALNPIRRLAAAVDLKQAREQIRKMPADNNKFNQANRARQEEQLRVVEELLKAPLLRRYAYYLDPQLHYAVRRLEQRYGAGPLLQRTDCSQFEQLAGRPLWLPRRIETQLYEWLTLPGATLPEGLLSQVTTVSAYDGSRVPDETFRLNYTEPGTIISDSTDPAAAKLKNGTVSYAIPQRLADLPAVIERARRGENMLAMGGGSPIGSVQVGGVPLGIVPLSQGYRGNAMLAIVLFNGVAIVAGVVYLGWRWRKGGAA